ncbi:hypothetical protein BDP27DRAFT_1423891 [Rhodocollybia butyracea]|uniref:Uncharacterized protein n=1 Tax=Rhodocollybia butyracea TaxID=206335 RepID=A0A9P5PN41_9AGAR|nr:hypothetical protein BDP27DRAFT_1423891 [Rhodocollybia butyracea]
MAKLKPDLRERRFGFYFSNMIIISSTPDVQGWNNLRKGKLAKWINETTRARVRVDIDACVNALGPDLQGSSTTTPFTTVPEDNESVSEAGDESDTDSEGEDSDFCNSIGTMGVVDGRFIAQTLDMDQTIEEVTALLESEFAEDMREIGGFSDNISDGESDSDKV